MFAQNQYQVDAERRRDIQRTAERDRQANERPQRTSQNMFTAFTRWMSNQSIQTENHSADQTQTSQQVAVGSV